LKQAHIYATDIASDPDISTVEKCHTVVQSVFDIIDGKTTEFPQCDLVVNLDPTNNPTVDTFFQEHFVAGDIVNADRNLGESYLHLVAEAANAIANDGEDEESAAPAGDDFQDEEIPF
jgi:hypothetical protein